MSARFYTPEVFKLGTRNSELGTTPEQIIGRDVVLDGPEAHHLAHVRRFAAGDRVTLFNGDGREYRAEVLSIDKRQVHLRVVEVAEPRIELGVDLHIAAALPKGDRGDFLIEKLTELGATNFTPLLTERSVVQPKPSIVEKLQRAVVESSKQCGRNALLRVHPPCRLERWVESKGLPDIKWIAHPGGRKPDRSNFRTNGLAAAIGPEGGFTDEELAAASQFGFESVSLGPRILRVETAALTVAAWMGLN
jgi:16S rRNA (uracil1498-N3)-methyltransferase